MSGAVELYKECSKAGIKPFPGEEFYFVRDRQDKKAKRYHMGLLALNVDGYGSLARLTSKSHTRENFHHKPLIDWTDLAEWKENGGTNSLALTTGCYFGLLIQTLVSDGPDAAKYLLERFVSLFPHTFVELQKHKIDQPGLSEDDIATALVQMADELGLPVLLTQDAHYCDPADKTVHETLKRVVAFGPDSDDAVFPGDGFHLCESAWVRAHHEEGHWAKGQEGFGHLLSLHDLAIPQLDKYTYNIPHTVSDPTDTLSTVCMERLRNRNLPQPYADRLGDELSVVADTGMAGYLLLVAEVTDWCRKHGIFTMARGSASGSLICWLLGITQCDPIKYQLRFERFISRDRTKPPDIDLDIDKERRQELIDWLSGRFTTCQIGTYLTYGINDDEKIAEEDRGKGSLIVAYKKVAKQQGLPKEDIDAIKTVYDIPEEWRKPLLELSDRDVCKAVGTHAGGVILTTTADEMHSLVPTMGIPSAKGFRTVSQYTMDQVEALGLVKLDVLGLRTLSLLRRCLALMDRDTDLEWIPLDDTRTFTAIRNGATAGVFQLEGGTAQRGCREIKVRSLKDIIVVQALYRPAVMKSGGKDTYIARREGREKMPEYHPLIMKSVKETYGVIIFQEQVISLLRDLGMQPDELTDFLKAIKGSQKADIIKATETIRQAQDTVWAMCDAKGITLEDFALVWTAIEGFAEYGFNRAHATAYGITAYRCAYLKTHHPLEFATALLQTSEGSKKEAQYVSAVRQMGISIRRPHVNISGASYSIDRKSKSVRKGLLSVPRVGVEAAKEIEANAPYTSVEDLIARCNARKVTGGKSWAKDASLNGHLGQLREAGALGDLIP
jgi:DNA polymerase-3 subunit alpha